MSFTPTRPPLPIRTQVPGVVRPRSDELGGRPVVICEIDAATGHGVLAERDSEGLEVAAQLALEERLPLVVIVASSGADVRAGIPALDAWGRAARAIVSASGIVPLLCAVTGPAVSGPAMLLGLADFVVMTEDAYSFVSGPHMVKQYTGIPVTKAGLGGAGVHGRTTGLASILVKDREEAILAVEDLLALLPSHADEIPPHLPTADPVDRPTPEAGDLVPASPTGSYDVRDVVRSVCDDGELLEIRPSWAANLVTGFATVGGAPIGVVANQPTTVAGTLDIPASQKGARFIAFCDAFNIPLLTLVDTPGFYPGKDLEWRGMIRHGAQMAFAYARATVPRISITLRKSYGGAYIVMDSKEMGSDLTLAWPSAEIAVMGAKGAVEILHRRETDPEVRLELERQYEERLLNPYIAAERGLIDAVIDPAETRQHIAAALAALETKREHIATRSHDNTPL